LEKVECSGLQNCYRVFNDTVDLIATTEVGPNIVRFGFIGDRNEFQGDPPHHYGRACHAPCSPKRKNGNSPPGLRWRLKNMLNLSGSPNLSKCDRYSKRNGHP